MIPVLLIVIPLLSGMITFLIKNEKSAKAWSLFAAIATLAVSVLGITVFRTEAWQHTTAEWLPLLGSSFTVGLDGMSQSLCLLTAIAFPVIFLATWNASYKKAHSFYAFMLLSQAGILGVFVALDGLLFYFFWELALIPAYFLCSQWGGEKRIAVTFKFFIYTFIGSLLMLIALIYLYQHSPEQSFSIESLISSAATLTSKEQNFLFWMFFIAFAVKMPIFPFHTWQPDAYEQSPTATTMVLSGVMVKMGLFGVIRWLIPIFPMATWLNGDTVALLSVIGIIYASLVAMQQDDLKRLIAYSSIAHIGLMSMAIFVTSEQGMQGVMIQMFNHGINIIAMWIVVELIERQFKTRKISELGGIAQKAPGLTIMLVIVALANVALPLTNAFIGEFLLFSGIFSSAVSKHGWMFAAVGGISIILSAVYTLNMIQKVFYGNTNQLTTGAKDLRVNEKFVLGVLVAVILVVGVYPKPLLELTQGSVDTILSKMIIKQPS